VAGFSIEKLADESLAERSRRASTILRRLRTVYDARCALLHDNPFQLLVATILSAQSTDEQVNKVTPGLFAAYPDPAAFAAATQAELERAIGSIGLFRNKAKSIRGAAARIIEVYDGEVPRTMPALLTLPGVARKTANVVLGTAFGKATGVVVDTHVKRLSFRMGLTAEEQNTDRIEKDLMQVINRGRWIEAAHNLIWHGRRVCDARKPRCSGCLVADLCPRQGVENSA
jgi:endonuclease-3